MSMILEMTQIHGEVETLKAEAMDAEVKRAGK